MTTGQNLGHFFIAIDIEAFMPIKKFEQRISHFLNDVESSKLAPGNTQILIPGEREFRTYQERTVNGIPYDEDCINEINMLCTDLKLAVRI